MPCDSVITNSVDLPKMHPELLKGALQALGVTSVQNFTQANGSVTTCFDYEGQSYQLANGVLVGQDGQSEREVGRVADLLKQQYSVGVIKTTAARNGWSLQQIGPNRYKSVKR